MFTITYKVSEKSFAEKVLLTTSIDATVEEVIEFLKWVEKTKGSEGLMDIFITTYGARIEEMWKNYKEASGK